MKTTKDTQGGMAMNKQYWGAGTVGGTLAALALAVACGDSFGGSTDCKASRTCPPAAGGDNGVGEGGGGADAISGTGAAAGTDTRSTDGGAGAGGGAAGASDGGCHNAAECSNSDPSDGEEICDQGVCGSGNPPPTVVSVTPDDDSLAIEPDTKVVIQFSEPLDPKTVSKTTIRVLDGEVAVDGTVTYADDKVTFTPTAPLALLAPYTVSVTTGVTDAAGAALLSAYSSAFSIRDGAWHEAATVVKDIKGQLSYGLPMKADGSALVVWTGTSSSYCPATARWFLRGNAIGAAKTLAIAGQTECSQMSSAGNANGVSAVVWEEPDSQGGLDVAQYRGDAWGGMPARVSTDYFAERPQVAVSPTGVVTMFDHNDFDGSKVWTTDADGKWPVEGDVISPFIAFGRTSVAFDSMGKGLAVWRAKDGVGVKPERILASRLATATGKWTTAVDLPGSLTTNPSSEAQRGIPTVAMDRNGDGVALWVTTAYPGALMASRFSQSKWAEAEGISGALSVDLLEVAAPALVFDGKAFVAAWTAKEGSAYYAYTARYDLTMGWEPYEKRQVDGDAASAPFMPVMATDGRGNLLLAWATGTAPAYKLVYQRYSAGAWGATTAVPGGAMTNEAFEGVQALPLAMSTNGLAALAWTNYDTVKYVSTVRLASFY